MYISSTYTCIQTCFKHIYTWRSHVQAPISSSVIYLKIVATSGHMYWLVDFDEETKSQKSKVSLIPCAMCKRSSGSCLQKSCISLSMSSLQLQKMDAWSVAVNTSQTWVEIWIRSRSWWYTQSSWFDKTYQTCYKFSLVIVTVFKIAGFYMKLLAPDKPPDNEEWLTEDLISKVCQSSEESSAKITAL